MKVTVLGDGAWGTAIATLLAHNGATVKLWCYDYAVAQDIKNRKINTRYLPGVVLSETIYSTLDMREALENAEVIFEAIPITFLRSIAQEASPYVNQNQLWIVLSKGIEQGTLCLPSEILDDVLGVQVQKGAVMGPSFAIELAHKQLTGLVVASKATVCAQKVAQLLHNEYCYVYSDDDVYGVQLCAALKNLLAIVIGMLEGAGYNDNARALVITEGLKEISMLCYLLGGKQITAYGLAGVGDLVLTAMGSASKNRRLGVLLGQGATLQDAAKHFGAMPEGVNTAQSIHELLIKKNINMPLLDGIYQVLFDNQLLSNLIKSLF